MVTTWHPALKHLSKIFEKNISNILKRSSTLKKVFPEKSIIAFRKMKSIKNIVRTDVNEANDQNKPKITTSCYSCKETCHLINSDETLKSIHNGKEIKKLDGENCRTANIVYAARCNIRGDIYIGNTGEELRENFSKHRYDAKNRPDNNELAAHIHKYQHEFDKDIEVLILKGNLHQKHERQLWDDKGLNIELKYYGPELYETFANMTV